MVYNQKARQAESSAGATINKEIACISSILSDQGCWERIRRDVKRLPENEEAGRALEPAEERMLLDQASNSGEHQGKWTPLHRDNTRTEYGDATQRDSDSTLEGCGLGESDLTRGRKQDKGWRRKAYSPYATRLGSP